MCYNKTKFTLFIKFMDMGKEAFVHGAIEPIGLEAEDFLPSFLLSFPFHSSFLLCLSSIYYFNLYFLVYFRLFMHFLLSVAVSFLPSFRSLFHFPFRLFPLLQPLLLSTSINSDYS